MFGKKQNGTGIAAQKPKKKLKKWKIAAAVIGAAVIIRIIGGIFLGGGAEALPVVDTAEVTEGDVTASLDTSGVIASELTRVYASPVNAQIGDIPAVVGQSVRKGEYLITYDTASLQKSYDIAELQAKAENAVSSDTLAKSSESAGDLAESAGEISALQGQIDALNAEISALQEKATGNELAGNKNAALNEEIAGLSTELEGIAARIADLEARQEQGSITDSEKNTLSQLKKQQKSKEKSIEKKKKSLKKSVDLANSQTKTQAQLAQKNSRLAELQGQLAEAEARNSAAEAGILSEAAKANISYTRQASKLTLEQSADDLSRAKAGVTADFDGIVTEIPVSSGTAAAEGTPLITLASADNMCVEVLVSKYNLENLKTGQEAVVSFQDQEYQGTISYISKIAQTTESGSAMVMVKIHIDRPDDRLILGLDAKVTIRLGTAEHVLIVPISAVNSDTTGDFVYTVEEGVVVRKDVTTGMASAGEMEIKSGILKGDKVITTVDSGIVEGMAVTERAQEDTEAEQLDAEPALTTEAAE